MYARAHCDSTFPVLVKIVPKALESLSNKFIFKYYQQTLRIIDEYRNNIVYSLEDFKRNDFTCYSSHRPISDSQLDIS